MSRSQSGIGYVFAAIFSVAVVTLLYMASRYSYLLFHSLVELFGLIIAGGIFIIAWNSRRFHTNNYLLVIGCGSLFAASFALMHMLTYNGMQVIPGNAGNLPTQLWIASRYSLALTFLAAPLLLGQRLVFFRMLAIYSIGAALVFASIFVWHIFPTCYVEGVGLTRFKIISEYVISALFLIDGVLLYLRRAAFDPRVLGLLLGSLAAAVACELAFTLYVGVYDTLNFVGHLLAILSNYLIYRAVIETALVQPYALLFRDLKQAHDDLDVRVQQRTAQLTRANMALIRHAQRIEILRQIDRAILAAQSPAEIAQTAVEHIQAALHCRRTSVVLYKPGDAAATLLAVAGNPKGALQPGARIAREALQLFSDGSQDTLKSLVDIALPPEHTWLADALLAEGARYCLSVPLAVASHTIGALYLWTETADGFGAEARDFAAQVSDSLAVAIDNARLFQQLSASRTQLQHLSHSLVEAQENQARQIGRDLHDDAGQALTALKLGLGLIARDPDCPPALADRAGALKQATDELMERLHALSVNLRPVSLDRLGLAAALRQYAETVQRQTDLALEMMVIGLDGVRLTPQIETTIYRVVQEAVTNIARHAQATRAGVIVERKPTVVTAIVEDNGIGFDPAVAEEQFRLGLAGMRERVEMLDGRFEIESQPGMGTTIFAEIPWSGARTGQR